jgi:anaerobic dimethyl sulfoxide reductase subunit A
MRPVHPWRVRRVIFFAQEAQMAQIDTPLERIPFTCSIDCAARCELVAVVRDGQILRIDTPPGQVDTDEQPRLVPCLRGRGQRRLLTSPERLLHPLQRVGPRGAGEFRRISWEQALDEVAERLADVAALHGHQAVMSLIGAGSLGGRGFSGREAARRFFSHWGPITGTNGHMSAWCANIANQWMLGGVRNAIPVPHLLDSRLILLWGMNPAENRHGANLAYYIAQARDAGAKVVLLDPRYTDSAVLADEWLPIRPGSDVALISAMIHEMIAHDAIDAAFVQSHTVGWDAYRGYILGEEDGQPKDAQWAAAITGLSADAIVVLTREYAAAKPALILAGLGPQRSRYGEQTERALITLATVSGNIGLRGGGMAHSGRHTDVQLPMEGLIELPMGPHAPARWIRQENWGRFLLDGSLQPPLRLAYICAANAINRSSNTQGNIRALETLDTIIVQDPYLTPTARYADILLPICVDLERTDIIAGYGDLYYNRQVVEPAGESRTDYWVLAQLARRLGFYEAFTQGLDEAGWVERILRGMGADGEALREDGVLRAPGAEVVDLAPFRADPLAHPLATPSGRVEIASETAVRHGLPLLPSYIENAPPDDTGTYPLYLVTPHYKLRANSTGYPNPWLLRLEPQRVWMNPVDAASRGIGDGDTVTVHNQYGAVRLPARVTERIKPGVVCIYQGAWYRPAADGVDEGGCANVLTGHGVSPTGGMAIHSERVEVER